MKYFNLMLISLILLVAGCQQPAIQQTAIFHDYNFIVANDLGRNGYFDQKAIADQMGLYTEKTDIEFVAAVGDTHHFDGVASVTDPLWLTNYEWIYSHPGLMIDWFSVLGNHEYRGNTQACIDYSNISRRWYMPDRYYTVVQQVDDSTTLRLIFVDTTPLIDRYRDDAVKYPDAVQQDITLQLNFVDSVLKVADETWTVVLGHHPVFANTTKSEQERADLQNRLDPLLRKYGVDFYFAGHIHNFQHLKSDDSPVNYFVTSSGSLSRPLKATENTLFASPETGFAICAVSHTSLAVNFINADGKVIYTFEKTR